MVGVGIDAHGYNEEVFENVKKVSFYWNDRLASYTDDKIVEVIESANFYTVVFKDRKGLLVLRYDDVAGFEIEFEEPLPALKTS